MLNDKKIKYEISMNQVEKLKADDKLGLLLDTFKILVKGLSTMSN